MNYAFFDVDLITELEFYEIKGADYEELVKVCFRYSESLSMWFSSFLDWGEQLKPYEINVDPNCFEYAPPYDRISPPKNDVGFHIHFYRICPELYHILMDHMHGIWDGYNYEKPSDMHFYRADGTCFFRTDSHNGECFFYLREGEDVSSVVSKENWHCESDLWPGAIPSPRPDGYRPLVK